ncbi:tRNA 2-selenouridine(34) synthase MnmH [Aquiflexum gelatinilyticum]|uniref:tRNA 2-selenouridine(34) synthase MnmH n=1 Tax=Aquiflexum gelatinilyticum TaxID=2961943 RepID=A0A9X2P9I1_9BACT|nr:tRNA 2-selenouridine(34) synthase MnmH [Aquiflexum gelatinilyticum]MCR9017341.1 tRNA 2-selenouridine(34) synthase MnmH [Aquiflexum gelatinilyticum]
MKETLIDLDRFLAMRESIPILDARSEGEFIQGHIPGSINLPILNNEERKIVGTIYKQQGNQEAIIKGFELVGPRFSSIIQEALALFPEKKILTYCWRGGMRSEIMSWLLSMAGFQILRLKGGYKTYRTLTYETVRAKRDFIVLGGKTGVGKTVLLHGLKKMGESVIDLEDLAKHKGSSFGGIGQPTQPSIEHFENLLAEELFKIPLSEKIWIENESRRIGKVNLADELYSNIIASPLIEISKSESERINHIAEEYAILPQNELLEAVKRLQKKLGGKRTAEAIEDIIAHRHSSWIANMLVYYDKTYGFELDSHKREQKFPLDLSNMDIEESIQQLLAIKHNIQWKNQLSD